MNTYAKLINGRPTYFKGPHNIFNPTEEQYIDYAQRHGYKQIISNPMPGIYYTESWIETDDEIQNIWTPFELDNAKNDAMEKVQYELTAALSARTELECNNIPNGIIYDNDAITNAEGDFRLATHMTDANNELHPITSDLIEDIKNSLATYRNELYTIANYRRSLINAATTVNEVENALTSTPE